MVDGKIYVRAPYLSAEVKTQSDTFEPLKSWKELKPKLFDFLMPANAIQKAAVHFLTLRQRQSESLSEQNIPFRAAIAKFDSAVERAGLNRNSLVAL